MPARFLLLAAALLAFAFVACGGGGTPSSTPVKSTPLAGTYAGQSWTAATGRASPWPFDDGGERWIDVSANAITCQDFAPEGQLIGTIPWHTGEAYDLGLKQNLTFVVRGDAGIENKVAFNGRVEVIAAPDAGVGTVRIRARFSDGFDVEGEVQLNVCD